MVGIRIAARLVHLTADGHLTHVLQVVDARDIQNVILLQGHVGRRTVQDSLNVNRQHLLRQVFPFTIQHRTPRKSFAQQPVGLLHQLAYRVQRTAQLEYSRVIHSPFHLQTVVEAVQNRIHRNHVTVC